LLAGCREPARVAWAANAQGLSLLSPPAWTAPHGEKRKEQQALALYLSGLLAEFDGDLSGARVQYEKAARHNPRNAELLIRQGILSLRLNETVSAEQALKAASEAAPEDPRPRFLLGVLFANQERLEEAAQQYAKVLQTDPANLGALSELAELYILQEKLEEGLAVYQRLIQERPDSPVLHFTLGVLYAKAEQWPGAIEHLSRAVELDPGNLEARLGLAVSYELAGQVEQARQEFLKALELEPANTQLIYYLARIAQRLGDLEQSARWLTRYLSFKPYEPAAHLELAYIRLQQGRWQEAVDSIQRIMASPHADQSASQLWTLMGVAYETGGKLEAAEEAYGQAIQAGGEEAAPYLHLGILYHRRAQYPQAEQMMQKAFERDPDDPQILNSLGYLYAEWGVHLEEAIRLIERALAQEPQNGAFMDSLGWAYFKAGQMEPALHLLEEAARRSPDSEIFDHLGQVYLTLGQEEKAEAIWKRGLSLNSQDQDIIQRLKSHLDALQHKRKD